MRQLQALFRIELRDMICCYSLHALFSQSHKQMQMIGLKLYMRFKNSSAPNRIGVVKTYVEFVILLCAFLDKCD